MIAIILQSVSIAFVSSITALITTWLTVEKLLDKEN